MNDLTANARVTAIEKSATGRVHEWWFLCFLVFFAEHETVPFNKDLFQSKIPEASPLRNTERCIL